MNKLYRFDVRFSESAPDTRKIKRKEMNYTYRVTEQYKIRKA